MPEVLADEDPGAPGVAGPSAERGVEGTETIAGRDVALLVEQPVRRQVHLAVHMGDLTSAEVEGRVVEAMLIAFEDQPGDDVDAPLA